MQKQLITSAILAIALTDKVPKPYALAFNPAYAYTAPYAPAYAPAYAPPYAPAYAPAYFPAHAYKPFAYDSGVIGYVADDRIIGEIQSDNPIEPIASFKQQDDEAFGDDIFFKTESQDAEGKVTGSFVIALPDGIIQTTTYTADKEKGFVADVTIGKKNLAKPTFKQVARDPDETFVDETGSIFKKTESQDAEGKVVGSFVITLPDGIIQTTTYTADKEKGFVAKTENQVYEAEFAKDSDVVDPNAIVRNE